jgi:FemAB-related protein (PEP-CTERM system-associated)
MMVNVYLYDDDGSSWDAYVTAHRDSTNYHLYDWRNVIEKSFGHATYYLVAKDGNQQICGLLPLTYLKSPLFGKFLVSLPFFNYGGMLSNDDEVAELLLKESRKILGNLQGEYAEFRHLESSLCALETQQNKVSMILALEKDEGAQWKAFNAKVRNQVRKAETSGLTAIAGHLELLDRFYEVFCRNMRDLGTPVYGKKFFRNILETFPDSTRIISVVLGGKTVASGILSWFKDSLEVPWASSINDYREMCPNNLLYWEAIRFAIRNGSAKFDFGRSTPGEGTFRFKKQWGAKPVQLYWQYLLEQGKSIPELNPKNPRYRLAIKIWQQLPLAVTNVLGPLIVRNIP